MFRGLLFFRTQCIYTGRHESMASIHDEIFLYADDIILLVPSVSILQTLVNVCERELVDLNMGINVRKSAYICFGLRSENTCANVVSAGVNIAWVTSTRYLGVYFESAVSFKC